MERREFSKKQERAQPLQPTRQHESTLIIYNGKDSSDTYDTELGDEILNTYASYNSTPKAKSKFEKKNEHTPDNRPGHSRSPRAVFSPASFSPTVATQSSKYKGRTNKGDVVCAFGEQRSAENWKSNSSTDFQPVIKVLPPVMEANTCYMFNQLRDIALGLEDAIHLLGEQLVSKNSLQDPERIDCPHQSEFVALGRICCDGNGRLNNKSVMLESPDGRTVPVDLSKVENYSVFPGQIVAVEGENPLGNKLTANKIHYDASLPPPLPPVEFSTEESGPIQIVVAAGPFTQSDTLIYQPLEDLVEYLKEHEPHVVILLGPFVDASHPHIVMGTLAETFLAYFGNIVDRFMERIKTLRTQVVLIPSTRDAHHHVVYPVPPFLLRKLHPKLTLASDPCLIDVQGVVIGATSTDVLFHLGKEEIAQGQAGSDRLGRIASHILYQRNFYPLSPPADDVNLDVDLWGKFAFLPVSPHILIVPSELRCFIKNLNGTIAVNPERLAKGLVGGNFARIEVSCKSKALSINAQIVKI